jgi:hypothetical protein
MISDKIGVLALKTHRFPKCDGAILKKMSKLLIDLKNITCQQQVLS